jgi:hypothetical protein
MRYLLLNASPLLVVLAAATAPAAALASPADQEQAPLSVDDIAQYFGGNGSGQSPTGNGEGYFPDTPRQSPGDPDFMNQEPRQPIILAMSIGAGAAWTSFNAVDETFFQPNDAYELGSRVMPNFEFSGYVEIQEVFRVGAIGNVMVGGGLDRSVAASGGGILLEAGGGDRTRVFGGLVIGGASARGETESIPTSDSAADVRNYEWRAGFVTYRAHVHVEQHINPWVTARVTPWVMLSSRVSEDFIVPAPRSAPTNVIPRDSGLRFGAAGINLSFTFGTGR